VEVFWNITQLMLMTAWWRHENSQAYSCLTTHDILHF
jgi:hypothetical protein